MLHVPATWLNSAAQHCRLARHWRKIVWYAIKSQIEFIKARNPQKSCKMKDSCMAPRPCKMLGISCNPLVRWHGKHFFLKTPWLQDTDCISMSCRSHQSCSCWAHVGCLLSLKKGQWVEMLETCAMGREWISVAAPRPCKMLGISCNPLVRWHGKHFFLKTPWLQDTECISMSCRSHQSCSCWAHVGCLLSLKKGQWVEMLETCAMGREW